MRQHKYFLKFMPQGSLNSSSIDLFFFVFGIIHSMLSAACSLKDKPIYGQNCGKVQGVEIMVGGES